MDPRLNLAWMPMVAAAALAAGCNADWSDRVPEVAAEPQAKSAAPAAPAAAEATPTSGEPTARPVESINDAALSAKVEAALKSEPDLRGSAIAVRSDAGVVTLSGTTKDPQLRSMAAEVALSIDGVKLVRNELEFAQEA